MSAPLDEVLAELGLSTAEYAVLCNVDDTVVARSAVLAEWTAHHLPRDTPANVTREECLAAIASLLTRGLLEELTRDELERDRGRWLAEAHPVSVGVDLRREPGDVDLTQAGHDLVRAIEARSGVPLGAPLVNYAAGPDGEFRVFGETEEACARCVRGLLANPPPEVRGFSIAPPEVEPMHPVGPWWNSRFVLVPAGHEVVIRFAR